MPALRAYLDMEEATRKYVRGSGSERVQLPELRVVEQLRVTFFLKEKRLGESEELDDYYRTNGESSEQLLIRSRDRSPLASRAASRDRSSVPMG